jgi:hypothetical protein
MLFTVLHNIFDTELFYFSPFYMMISGATAQTGPWPPFTGFMIVV